MMYKKNKFQVLLVFSAIVYLLVVLPWLTGTTSLAAENVIKLGGLIDLSGPTAISGKEYLEGVNDQIKIINDKGGINGQRVEVLWEDFRWKTPEAIKAIKKFAEQDKVVTILGEAALDTNAYIPLQKTYKIPYMTAGFNENFFRANENPYVFPVCASYISQTKAAMKYFKKYWKESSKPKIGFVVLPIYQEEIKAASEYAKELGMEVVNVQTVTIPLVDAKPQLINMAQFKPDLTFNFNNVQWAAVVLKDAKALGFKTTWAGHVWAFYEVLPELAGNAAEGVIQPHPITMYGDDVPGMKTLMALNPGRKFTSPYTFAAHLISIAAEGLKRAGARPTSEGVKNALETIKNFDTGLVPPISYSPTNHVPATSCRIYVLEKGKFVFKEVISGE